MVDQLNKIKNESDSIPIKQQIGVHLFPETLEATEDTVFYMRKQLSTTKRKKLTKSIFFEIALKAAITDYKDHGIESSIWKMVEEWFETY